MRMCRGRLTLLVVLAAVALAAPAAARTAPFLPRNLLSTPDTSIVIEVSTNHIEYSGEYVNVSWSGVASPAATDMLAMYLADKDPTTSLPMKYIWTSLSESAGAPGSGSYSFQVYNYYEPIKFLFLRGGFSNKSLVAESEPVTAGNPQQPTQIKLAFTEDPSEMRVTWLTQFEGAPFVRYGLAEDELDAQVPANVTTYTAADLCGAPANSTGWKAPGTINSGVMADLEPNTRYYYVVGDEAANTTSTVSSFISAPGPDDTVKLLAFADVGQYNEDGTKGFGYWYDTYGLFDEVYAIGTLQYTALQAVLVTLSQQADQDGTILVYPALIEEASTGEYHSAWHNGDVSYARGMAWQWDTFGHLMEPLSSRVPTMYSPGNHEYDWPTAHDSQFAEAIDSGGECGVPYKMRAPMPTVSSDDLFYSIDHGPIHFLQLNTEARFDEDSEQYKFVVRDLFTVDRSKTPWVVVGFHRMMYTDAFDGVSEASAQRVAAEMRDVFEAMFVYFGVDMTWQGHNHVYQRTCPVFNNTCVGYDKEGVARGPIHVTMGHAGFMLSPSYQPVEAAAFADTPELAFFGYCRAEVNRTHFNLQMLDALNQTVRDEIRLYKPLGWELDVNATQALISDTPGAPFTDNPTNAGFKYIISTIFPKLLLSDIVGALSIIGQGTPIYAKLNAHPSRPISAEFMTQTAQSVIDFVTPLVNATNLQEIAGAALPMSAEAIMESFDWVASAWKGRIAELVGAQDYAEA